ncbi:MAG: hypothetical protein WD670_03455 [Actinomycetota bacterium]
MTTSGTAAQTPARSTADRIARQLLLIEDAAPRSLVSLRGSLVITAIRCTLTYALIPALSPLIGWMGAVATPVSLVLSLAAIALSINSLRRVWLANYVHRWAYTGFITLVVTLLAYVVVGDVRTLLG